MTVPKGDCRQVMEVALATEQLRSVDQPTWRQPGRETLLMRMFSEPPWFSHALWYSFEKMTASLVARLKNDRSPAASQLTTSATPPFMSTMTPSLTQ